VLAWAQEALDVLVYLHGRQPAVIHGDIKPSHLILDSAWRAHLIGLASIGTPAARAQPPIGTAGYAPPEQFDEAPGPAWDLYALAATMHHLLTGRDPRDFTSPGELWIFPPPRWLNAGLSERTEGLIMRALEKDPHKRYADAVAMRDDVVLARNPAPRGGRRWPWPRRDA
jgi:serine/threonine-protein kinase